MSHLVLIGDVVRSRSVKDRKRLQAKMETIFQHLNQESEHIISPYTITLGDEFQAVFSKASTIFPDVFHILANTSPTLIRFSLSAGEISTKINTSQAIGMDGPAFHAAREGITYLRDQKALFAVYGLPEQSAFLIKNYLLLFSSLIQKWRANRLQLFELYLRDVPILDIARALNLTDKAVYKAIKTSQLKAMRAIFNEIRKQLNQALEEE